MQLIIILTIVFFGIDFVSKIVVSNLMNVNHSIQIIKNFFYITYVRNTGAAWSIFSEKTWLVVILSFTIILFIIYYIYINKPNSRFEKVAYSMILGGAIGNFFDRIVYGYVIDFFDFYIFGYNYPIFNLADSFIVIGVVFLVICIWRSKDEN